MRPCPFSTSTGGAFWKIPANLLSALGFRSTIGHFLPYRLVGLPCPFCTRVLLNRVNRHSFCGGPLEGFQARNVGVEDRYSLPLQYGSELRAVWLRRRGGLRQQHSVFVSGELSSCLKGQNQHVR